jgi:hypothetical protein
MHYMYHSTDFSQQPCCRMQLLRCSWDSEKLSNTPKLSPTFDCTTFLPLPSFPARVGPHNPCFSPEHRFEEPCGEGNYLSLFVLFWAQVKKIFRGRNCVLVTKSLVLPDPEQSHSTDEARLQAEGDSRGKIQPSPSSFRKGFCALQCYLSFSGGLHGSTSELNPVSTVCCKFQAMRNELHGNWEWS